MSWRDNLRPASVNGAKFQVDSSEYEFGRKNIFHDYPFRDVSELEDQGTLTDVFVVTGYIVQNKKNDFDYFTERNDLIEALKSAGSITLIHPFYGEKTVGLSSPVRLREKINSGAGIARFTLSFKDIGIDEGVPIIQPKPKPPFVVKDPIQEMDKKAEEASNIFSDAFDAAMDATADLAKISANMQSGMQDINSKIRQVTSLPGTVISIGTSFILASTNLANSVLGSPCALANSITGAFDAFLFAAGMLENAVSRDILSSCSGRVLNTEDASRNSDDLSQAEGLSLTQEATKLLTFGSDLTVINVVSPASGTDYANQLAIIDLFRAQALQVACRMAVRTNFVSQDAANALLLFMTNLINDYLDYLGEIAGDDTLANQGIAYSNDDIYQGVTDLKSALKESMELIGANLAKIIQFPVGVGVLSTLVLSYDKYEDLEREEEIIDRNKALIINPCFIPNGKSINILSE